MKAPAILLLAAALAPSLRAASETEQPAGIALSPRAQALLASSLRFDEGYYDDRAALLWSQAPEDNRPGASRVHRVRESGWYALGLLVRDHPGDQARAQRIFATVLDQQMVAPGMPWDGTFYRSPEEPPVPPGTEIWSHIYDSNLRQFIGCTLALAMETCGARIPAAMRERMRAAIARAVSGEIKQGRLPARYTNIALMQAWLLSYAGSHDRNPDWLEQGEALARAIDGGFREHGAFAEYNSPTYYGVDFFGLALWRAHGPTPLFRQLGPELEAALWRDVASFYHAGLKNICGPYDRTYGMDMNHYVAAIAPWLSLAIDPALVPLPDPRQSMAHALDLAWGPCLAVLDVRVPADALPSFQHFRGEHAVVQPIDDTRVATAWLGKDIMLGGEITGQTRAAGTGSGQFTPATIHWRSPNGEIVWVRLLKAPRCDARAQKNELVVTGVGDFTFQIGLAGQKAGRLSAGTWELPGLVVRIDTDATGFQTKSDGDQVEVQYREATKFDLRTALLQ